MKYPRSHDQIIIECFTPTKGVTLSGVHTPQGYDEVYKIFADVVITIDGVDGAYTSGDEICLRHGIAYTFSAATPAHKM